MVFIPTSKRDMLVGYILVFTLFFGAVSSALADDLPDVSKTSGDAFPVTKDQVCKTGYTDCVRHVTNATSTRIYKSYSIASHKPHEYEIDHLISLELGGSNSDMNLWPQSYVTKPLNAKTKDYLENKLNELVCTGKMTLEEAQQLITNDWIAAFNQYGGRATPIKHDQRVSRQECTDLHLQLVVNN